MNIMQCLTFGPAKKKILSGYFLNTAIALYTFDSLGNVYYKKYGKQIQCDIYYLSFVKSYLPFCKEINLKTSLFDNL